MHLKNIWESITSSSTPRIFLHHCFHHAINSMNRPKRPPKRRHKITKMMFHCIFIYSSLCLRNHTYFSVVKHIQWNAVKIVMDSLAFWMPLNLSQCLFLDNFHLFMLPHLSNSKKLHTICSYFINISDFSIRITSQLTHLCSKNLFSAKIFPLPVIEKFRAKTESDREFEITIKTHLPKGSEAPRNIALASKFNHLVLQFTITDSTWLSRDLWLTEEMHDHLEKTFLLWVGASGKAKENWGDAERFCGMFEVMSRIEIVLVRSQ